MNLEQSDLQKEIERRAKIYEELDVKGRTAGAMSVVDYSALIILVVSLVVFFWVWSQ